ncbi:hypothetical protein BBK36DRAFT_1140168 [Trichoderma citrinoviride]|uniref:Uncharacterized protein n=1 Tax=Trichoderma citrinoviride TaxID=58853 RepID=A0A2T4BE92_9HYPO|nr:hypothetical protein BBK36DRAFT_1140168 [Trichoderma citrinoviride]PTB67519.1 hypothetical protein BBK36DRAFT_1140168 [Trichoderma citrinoviride]
MAKLKIGELRITNPTMRTFDLEATVIVDEWLGDLDWTSHLTVSLSYQPRLIGKATLCDTYFIPDNRKKVSIKFEGFDIRNMGLTIAGRGVDEAHELSLDIELSGISKTSVEDFSIQVAEKTVILDFNISSSNPVKLDFGDCVFSLEQGGETLAILEGYFRIEPNEAVIALMGDAMYADARYCGFATLKGVRVLEEIVALISGSELYRECFLKARGRNPSGEEAPGRSALPAVK